MDPNINSNGIYSFLKRPKLLQHREIRLFYIEFLNVVNPHFPDATPILGCACIAKIGLSRVRYNYFSK
ncbi:hypothetical protein BCJMU51_p1003 (plasmid) [Bacillus cereus]|uniref:hypothetical protein n=2 Tax=Bacillus cereus group TaxID=86661 RepID=UPI001C32050E